MSSTNSPGRTAASATTRVAHSSVSGYQPHARRDRAVADMTDHVHDGSHATTLGGAARRPQRVSAPPSPAGGRRRFERGRRWWAVFTRETIWLKESGHGD